MAGIEFEIRKELIETLEDNPRIERVFFDANGDWYFNAPKIQMATDYTKGGLFINKKEVVGYSRREVFDAYKNKSVNGIASDNSKSKKSRVI